MNKPENMEARLWDYIDGLSSEQERSFISKLIDENIEWRRKYHELLDVHLLMQHDIELDEPSMRFTQNVMDIVAHEKIAPAASSYIKKSVIRGIAAFFLITLAGVLGWLLINMDWAAASKSAPVLQLPEVNVSRYMNSTLVCSMAIITAVLGLMLLDMTLRKKQKRNREMMDH